ncbi:MAG: putative signal transduction protein [Chloroflexi bacterium]|nr:MAG: putative signal transduction protein [Chloroflexota bacterium]
MFEFRLRGRGSSSAPVGAAAAWDSDEAIANESARITRWLAAAAVIGLAAIGALAIYSTIEISAALTRQSDDAASVALTSSQRGLSARLSEAALIASVAGSPELIDLGTQDVAALVVQLGNNDAQLSNDVSLTRDGDLAAWAAATHLLFVDLELAGTAFLNDATPDGRPNALAQLFANEENYRAAIGILQAQLEGIAAANVSQTNRRATLLLGLTLCLLALEGLFLFRPVIRRVRGRAHDAAVERESRFSSLIQNSPDVVTVLDAGQRIAFASPSAAAIWGRDPKALRGTDFLALMATNDRARVAASLAETVAGAATGGSIEWRLQHSPERLLDIASSVSLMETSSGDVQLVVNSRDVSDHKALERRLSQQALHDHLTGLPNRLRFLQYVDQATDAQPDSEATAVLFVDIDRFKVVNDTLGHLAGDALLRLAAARLQRILPGRHLVARLGGDEFAFVLPQQRSQAGIMDAAGAVSDAFQQPLVIDGREIEVGLSIGIGIGIGATAATTTLMRDADVALHTAKSRGGGHIVVYDETLNAFTEERLRLENDLHHAVERDELRVYYQPVVDPLRRKACGMEALIRWQHPTEGLLNPGRFIEIAETTGQIDMIGRWILRQACLDLGRWVSEGVAESIYVSVNVAAAQLQDATLPQQVRAALEEAGLSPRQLELEVTETSLLADIATSQRNLEAIRAMGVRVAIDDFGTGYSSLNYLRQLPVDTLKVDKSFMDEVARDHQAQKLFTAIVGIADSLDLAVTVEGVETASQLQRVIEAGCGRVQGYYFSPPVPPPAMEAVLRGVTTWADAAA